jgi:Protein of unknown function (DUF1559)
VRRAAARSQCANNLKQIALGLHNYADTQAPGKSSQERERSLPAGTVFNADLSPQQRLSWCVELLPFVEQDNLYRGFDRKAGWDAPANSMASRTSLKILLCPDWGREAESNPPFLTAYLGVAGLGADAATLPVGNRNAGVFGYERRTSLTAIKDGTSNTLLILESARDNGPWAQGGRATVRGLDPLEPENRPEFGPRILEPSVAHTEDQVVDKRLDGDGDRVRVGVGLHPGKRVLGLQPGLGDHLLVEHPGDGAEKVSVPLEGLPLHFLRAVGVGGVDVVGGHLHEPALVRVSGHFPRVQVLLHQLAGLDGTPGPELEPRRALRDGDVELRRVLLSRGKAYHLLRVVAPPAGVGLQALAHQVN